MRDTWAVSARRRLGAVILLACALAVVTGMLAGCSIPLPGAVVPAAPGSASPPRGSTTATGGDGPALRLAGQHSFAAPALGSGASWTLSLASDGDESQVIDEATGATVTFDLPAVDDEATTYTVRASSGTVTDTRRITVFSPDAVIRLGGVGAPDLRTYTVVPSTLSPATHVLLVLHGVGRDAEEYCASWVAWASNADYLVLCPEFDEDDWPGAAGYNLGNVFSDDEGGAVNPEQEWAFTAAEDVHRFAASGFGLHDTLFDMWGHSAGAQFVQRFVLFKPQSAVRFAIAANAGWYTILDPALDIPYGVRHPEVDIDPSATRKHLVVMRGQLDIERDGSLRDDRKADAQGLHRYARAGHAHATALARDPETNWQLLDVPDVGHDQQLMAPAAQRFLLDAGGALPRS